MSVATTSQPRLHNARLEPYEEQQQREHKHNEHARRKASAAAQLDGPGCTPSTNGEQDGESECKSLSRKPDGSAVEGAVVALGDDKGGGPERKGEEGNVLCQMGGFEHGSVMHEACTIIGAWGVRSVRSTMKALFNRTFNRSSSLKDKDGSAAATAHAAAAAVATKEKSVPSLPPLPVWPPPSHRPPSATSHPSLKPLPDVAARPLPPIQDDVPESDPAKTRPGGAAPGGGDVPKKVAFMSPPSTPSAPLVRGADGAERKGSSGAPDAPLKTTVSRLQASHGAESRVSSSTATSSKTYIGSNGKAPNKATTTRGVTTPPYTAQRDFASPLRSGSPYSTQSATTASRIMATASWSEAAEEDLVSNLGPRERTRQEVLWEIVASEERYVAELLKLKDTFIDPLLHPYATSPISSPTLPEGDDYYGLRLEALSPQESIEHLPIASRFLSPSPFDGTHTPPPHPPPPLGSVTPPVIDGDSVDSDEEEDRMGKGYAAHVNNHPRSPYRTRNTSATTTRNGKTLPFPSRSHHSLPPPPRPNQHATSTSSLGRQSYVGPSSADDRKTTTTSQRVLRKLKKSQTGPPPDTAIPPHLLPDDLRRCLEVIETGILSGHLILSEGLRKRYDEQYPLVRSLADVFVTNVSPHSLCSEHRSHCFQSHILREYATYVLHLERALEQVDDALSLASATKRPKKQTEAEWLKLSKYLQVCLSPCPLSLFYHLVSIALGRIGC